MERSILHCDMNHFYASVERLYDASLFGKPIAVCGDREKRHGIVLAKSDEAKKMGVKTGEAIWQAKEKCRDLIVVPTHFDRYVKYSRLARDIYLEYTDLVEPFGMDECWLDVTASHLAFGSGKTIGEEIRRRIREELGLTVSVGVSFNKVFAKMGSDMKKPDALTYIPKENFRAILWNRPVEEMLWVGPKTGSTLHRFGIHTLGNLASADPYFLRLQFGKNGEMLRLCAAGEDTTPVLPSDASAPMKSIGHGTTTPEDLTSEEEIWNLIFSLAQSIGEKLRYHGKSARGVALECKDDLFSCKIIQKRLSQPTDCTMTLAKEAFLLFRERYLFHRPIRSLALRAIDLESREGGEQLSLFTEKKDLRNNILDRVSDSLHARFGKAALCPASLLANPLLSEEDSEYIPFSSRL